MYIKNYKITNYEDADGDENNDDIIYTVEITIPRLAALKKYAYDFYHILYFYRGDIL